MNQEIKLPEPDGYLCDWGNDSYGLTHQTVYYGEPGSASADDWNEYPKVHCNTHIYTADTVRRLIEAEREKSRALYEGTVRQAMRIAELVSKLAAPQGEAVFLVATGEVHNGEETYTRHEGSPPPLCEYETLYTQPTSQSAKSDEELLEIIGDLETQIYQLRNPAPEAKQEPVAWQPLPYKTPDELYKAFKDGVKFTLHYYDKQYQVERMGAREHVVYVQPPGSAVKLRHDGSSAEGNKPGEGIWLRHTTPQPEPVNMALLEASKNVISKWFAPEDRGEEGLLDFQMSMDALSAEIAAVDRMQSPSTPKGAQ